MTNTHKKASRKKCESSDDNQSRLEYWWQQFNERFPTDKDCVEEVAMRIDEAKKVCRHCACRDIERPYGGRPAQCKNCKKLTWLTSDTLLDGVRHIRAWLAAIWLLEHGVIINASDFHKLVGVAYSTALNIFKKVSMVILSMMGQEAEVDSSNFAAIVNKRSLETPKRQHPIAEQKDAEAESGGANNSNGSSACEAEENLDQLNEFERRVYKSLTPEPVHFDDLVESTGMSAAEISAALSMLEIWGLAYSVPGNRFARRAPNPSRKHQMTGVLADLASKIVALITFYFQGISRKYLQLYVAAYWCYTDRKKWCEGALLDACIRHRSIGYDEIVDYVTPLLVKICGY